MRRNPQTNVQCPRNWIGNHWIRNTDSVFYQSELAVGSLNKKSEYISVTTILPRQPLRSFTELVSAMLCMWKLMVVYTVPIQIHFLDFWARPKMRNLTLTVAKLVPTDYTSFANILQQRSLRSAMQLVYTLQLQAKAHFPEALAHMLHGDPRSP